MNPEDLADPVALAREFVGGRNLKRSTLVEVMADLLTLIDELQFPKATCAAINDIPRGVPAIEGYDGRPPIKVETGAAGSVYLGPESNRYYTRSEAIALAGAIARATTQR